MVLKQWKLLSCSENRDLVQDGARKSKEKQKVIETDYALSGDELKIEGQIDNNNNTNSIKQTATRRQRPIKD